MGRRRRVLSYATQLSAGITEYAAARKCTAREACERLRAAAGYADNSPAITNMCNPKYEVGRYRPSAAKHRLIVTFFVHAGLPHVAERLEESYQGESAVLAAARKAARKAKDDDPEVQGVWLEIPDDDV